MDSPSILQQEENQASGKSKHKYDRVIIFEPNELLEKPFSIMRLDVFKGSNFPWGLIEGAMTEEMRAAKYPINALDMCDEGPFCIFAKIESGK